VPYGGLEGSTFPVCVTDIESMQVAAVVRHEVHTLNNINVPPRVKV
jgi:hypothetical protein